MCVWPAMVDNTYCFSIKDDCCKYKLEIDLDLDIKNPGSSETPNFLVTFGQNIIVSNPNIVGSSGTDIADIPISGPTPLTLGNSVILDCDPGEGKCGLENAIISYEPITIGTQQFYQIKFTKGILKPPTNYSAPTTQYDVTDDTLLIWSSKS